MIFTTFRALRASARGRSGGTGPAAADVVALAKQFGAQVEVDRLIADVATLARSPRGRGHQLEAMARAESYVAARLAESGWLVRRAPFEKRWVLGVSDSGRQASTLRRLRLFRRLRGVNLIADLPGSPSAGRVLLLAHLDTVVGSPGADDNASGVAALIECARLLASLPEPPAVQLAVLDLEELGKIGSRALADDPEFTRGLGVAICLESIGVFLDEPQTQRLGGLELLFRELGKRVAENQHRGDFALVICRRSSSAIARALTTAGAALTEPLPVLSACDPRPDGRLGVLATALLPPLSNLSRSDHAPFWNRRVPALMVTTTAPFRNRHYHRSGDTPEKLDYPRLAALTAALAAVTAVAGQGRAAPSARR